MEKILFIIKVWSILQFTIIILLILFFTVTRFIVNYKIKKRKEKINKINKLLNEINDNPQVLTPSVIHFFNRSILEFIMCLEEVDRKNYDNPNWYRTKKMISDLILKKQSKKLASSHNWFKRYLAIRCYELGLNIEDEKTLLKLIRDDNLIISINAAVQIFNKPNPNSINKMIDILSKGRHILQNTFASLLTSIPHENISMIRDIFIARLHEEKDIYVRMFCYRILNNLSPLDKVDSFIEKDLLSKNIDLKIQALRYLSHINGNKSIPVLLNDLNDTHSEIRTIVVKLLGKIGDKSVIPNLKDKLNDPEWWVRINTANSLINFGDDGIAVLKEQSLQDGRFAYETAQAFLKIYGNREKE